MSEGEAGGPLRGLAVVEFAGVGPGPFAVMMLADMGATVVRVDRTGPSSADYVANPVLERGRRSIAVDLKHPAGVDVVRRLVARADALVESYRPGVMERLGIGPADCLAVNPVLVYGRMSGWGQDGPLAHDAGHDINYISLTGALHAIGRAGGPPQPPLNLVGDFGGGYECADGGYVAVGTIELKFFHNLLDVLGLGSDAWLAGSHRDRSRWPELRTALARAFRSAPRDEWAKRFAGRQACVTPVLTLAEAQREPQALARAAYIPLPDGPDSAQPAPAPRFSRTAPRVPGRAPVPGEHTEQILGELGVSASEIASLLDSGAVATAVG